MRKEAPRSGSLAISCVTVNALSPGVRVSPSLAFRLDRMAASTHRVPGAGTWSVGRPTASCASLGLVVIFSLPRCG